MIPISQLINNRIKGSNPGLLKTYLGQVPCVLPFMIQQENHGIWPKDYSFFKSKTC